MKLPIAAALIAATTSLTLSAALAQSPSAAAQKSKAAAPVPRPALQTPSDTANDMAQADRLSIQSDLAWIGVYNGAINGEVNERMVAAIKEYQKDTGAKQTGVLNPKERESLSDAAVKLQNNVGWKAVSDPATGARLGIPSKLVPTMTMDTNGTRWASTTGTIQIEITRRKEASPTIAAVAETERKSSGRRIEYSAVKPDFFVLSGMQGLKKFYVRGQIRGGEARLMTVLYDQATEGTMTPVTIAMSSAFVPFPGGGSAAVASVTRKQVEYSTGIVVNADGAILADRQATEGCQTLVVSGYGNGTRIAEDEARDLALVRVYGAAGLTPMPLASPNAPKPDAVMSGISDPQAQGGGIAVSAVSGTGNADGSLQASLPQGFNGAAITDRDGVFAGVARTRPTVVATTGAPPAASSAAFTSAQNVQAFLRANRVAFATGAGNPKASLLRLICVRK